MFTSAILPDFSARRTLCLATAVAQLAQLVQFCSIKAHLDGMMVQD